MLSSWRFSLKIASLLVIFSGLFITVSNSASVKPQHSQFHRKSKVELSTAGDGYRSIAYFVNWGIYARAFPPQRLPADKLTHVMYAFANLRTDGEVYLTDSWADAEIHFPGDSTNETGTNLYGSLKQLNLLKQQNRNLKVLLSVGGSTYSSNFGAPMSNARGRAKFATSAVQLVKDYGFDGLDIDWEYPRNASQAQNWVDLLKVCREELDKYSRTLPQPYHFELAVACPAGPQNIAHLDITGMDQYLDFWNLMAYDYAGSWDNTTGYLANVYPSKENPRTTPFNTVQAVDAYKSKGVAANKIVIGMPLFGRAFTNTNGIGQPYSGIGSGSWENGVWDYKALPLNGSQVYLDKEIIASYSYDNSSRLLVSYDTPRIAKLKAKWIKDQCLGGGMWWEASGDKTGDESLITTVVRKFKKLESKQNLVNYPDSKYDNLRNGFRSGNGITAGQG